jgi:alpha-mannosidase
LQRFSYAFLPHQGNVVEAGISEYAEMFNRAPVMLPGVDGSVINIPVRIDSSAVVLSCCKRAEKSDDLIIRLAERYGKTSRITLTWESERYDGAAECDLMEWREINDFSQEKLDLQFHPFEIKTIRLKHRG